VSAVRRDWPTESPTSRFSRDAHGETSARTRVPYREGNSMGGLPFIRRLLLAPAYPIEKVTLWEGFL